MPISRINPDGTVKIYNKKTKEIKDVAPEELAKFNPALENDYQVLLSLKEGKTSLSDLPAEQKPLFTGALQASGFTPPPTSATERTSSNRFQSALDLTHEFDLGKRYEKANTGPAQAAWTGIFQNVAPQLVDKSLLELESNVGPIREAVINAISGAQVSEQEAKRVKSWIPSIGKSKEKNKADLNSLNTWLKANYKNISNQEYSPKKGKSSGKYVIEEIE
mgnify:CR=1 FL=1